MHADKQSAKGDWNNSSSTYWKCRLTLLMYAYQLVLQLNSSRMHEKINSLKIDICQQSSCVIIYIKFLPSPRHHLARERVCQMDYNPIFLCGRLSWVWMGWWKIFMSDIYKPLLLFNTLYSPTSEDDFAFFTTMHIRSRVLSHACYCRYFWHWNIFFPSQYWLHYFSSISIAITLIVR